MEIAVTLHSILIQTPASHSDVPAQGTGVESLPKAFLSRATQPALLSHTMFWLGSRPTPG